MKRAIAAIAVAGAVASVSPAVAQTGDEVRLVLLEQTAAITSRQDLSIRVAAVNEGDATFRNLTLTVSTAPPAQSRTEYDQALALGSVSASATATRELQGSLDPGATRPFQPVQLSLGAGAPDDNALLPVTVELRADGGFTPVATLRTAVVHITETPTAPLNVSVSFVLDLPFQRRPDGTYLDDTIEDAIAPGGRLDTIVGALQTVPVTVTLVISPLLLEELAGMGEGYRIEREDGVESVAADDPRAQAAAAMVERIGAVSRTPGTEVIALPYASPSVPAMTASGLDDDLAEQIRRGRDVIASVLGVTPSTTLFRPPGGTLTEESLQPLREILAEDGTAEALLLDPGTLASPTGLTLSPPGVAIAGSDESGLVAITPDTTVARRLLDPVDDPRLAAMRTIGELSALYFEQPSLDRGAAIVFGEDTPVDRALIERLLAGLRTREGVNWLQAETATRVLIAETSPEDPDPVPLRLRAPERVPTFADPFLTELSQSRAELAALASVGAAQELVDQIGTNTLVAESRYLLDDEALARSYLEDIAASVESELSKVHPPSPTTITLTSNAGNLPVTLRNDAGYPVEVSLTLSAPRLRFVGGPRRLVVLEQEQQAFVFPVRAQTTGRFPVDVLVETPTGKQIASSRIVVRSTAYNRVALLLTVGAGLFLVVWWGRRLVPRRKS